MHGAQASLVQEKKKSMALQTTSIGFSSQDHQYEQPKGTSTEGSAISKNNSNVLLEVIRQRPH